MLALISVWMGVVCLGMAAAMIVRPQTISQATLILFLEVLAPGALCLAGLTLWAHRKDESGDAGVAARRLQAKVAITLTLLGCALVYYFFFGLALPDPAAR